MLRIFRYDWIKIFGLQPSDEIIMEKMLNIFSLTLMIDGLQISMAGTLNAVGFHSYTLNV